MLDTRWRKLGRDLFLERGRALLMVVAVAVSLIAVGTVLGAYSILTREISLSYLGTHPASATLELPEGAGESIVERARRDPAIEEAEARDVILARAQVGGDWRPLLLFVIDDFDDLRLNAFVRESGAWPPPEGTMLIERSAVPILEATAGQSILVKTPNGAARAVPISGLVHDPGLAPAWQEREGYAYVTRSTAVALGESGDLHELRIRVSATDVAGIEASAAELARTLEADGHPVHQIRVPPPMMHPHQRQMTVILLLLLSFSGMALILSAILVATTIATMVARQVREIGVMKTIGARSDQIAAMYVVWIGAIGAIACLLAWPLGVLGARSFSYEVGAMLNFTLSSVSIPGWVYAVQGAAGVLVALALGSVPIARATRVTIRQAIDDHGIGGEKTRASFSSLPIAARNALRRPARLALSVGLLSAGGAMFMTALNVRESWQKNLDKVEETRHYDVEVRFHAPEPTALAEDLVRIPGVRAVEAWGYSESAFARPKQIDVVRTYPDRGHGSLAVLAPPPKTGLISFPIKAGRWLEERDTDAVVLNHAAMAQAKHPPLGASILLSIDGRQTTWSLAGVVEEIGSPGAAYVTRDAFEQAVDSRGRARMLRIAMDPASPRDRAEAIRTIERSLEERGARVETLMPLLELRNGVSEHIGILIRALLGMASIMAIVGMLGLASSTSMNVLERVREIGVMKALGATPARIARMIVQEAMLAGVASWFVALAVSLPLSAGVDALVGNAGFVAPLPFAVLPSAALMWIGLVSTVSIVAALVPARRAAALSVREAVAHL